MENEKDILQRYVSKLQNNTEKITLASLKHEANKLTEEKKREARINVYSILLNLFKALSWSIVWLLV